MLSILCISCQKPTVNRDNIPEASSIQANPVSAAAITSMYVSTYNSEDPDNIILTNPNSEVLQKGKELLDEYNVQYDETIRFPYKEQVYQTHGAYAITSLEVARERYPEWPIPEALGEYQFKDLTIYPDRTSTVFPNEVPRPKDSIEILEDKAPVEYYLCYQKGDSQFQITMIPMYMEDGQDAFSYMQVVCDEWPSHPDIRIFRNADNPLQLDGIVIEAEPGWDYGFVVRKPSTSDCLECDDAPFSEEEALSIYEGIREGF